MAEPESLAAESAPEPAVKKHRSPLARLFGQVAVYTGAGIIGSIVPILILPILTYYLTPEDYGLVASFMALVAWAITFIGLDTQRAATRRFFDLDKKEMADYFASCILIMLFGAVVMTAVFTLGGKPLSKLTEFPVAWLWTVPAVCAMEFVWRCALVYWRASGQAVRFSSFNISFSIINIGLSVVFVIGFSMNWRGRVLGIIASNAIFMIIALRFLIRSEYLSFSPRRAYVRDAVRFGAPLIAQNFSAWLQKWSSRFFLNKMVNLSTTGLYSVGFTFASVTSFVVASFNNAWSPWLYAQLKDDHPKMKKRIVLLTYLYMGALVSGAFFVGYVGPRIVALILNKRFLGAADYIFWISLGFAFQGMQYMMEGYILFENQSLILARISLIAGGVSLLANFILIRLHGAMGAAQAMALSFFAAFVLSWRAAQKTHPMPWLFFRPSRRPAQTPEARS